MATTQNINIEGLISRSRRYKEEWRRSQSGNVSHVSSFDAKRLESYIGSMHAYIDFFQSQDDLDTPEAHGSGVIDLGEPSPEVKVENEAVNDILSLWRLLEVELVNCQSSRLTGKLISHDEVRVRAILKQMSNFLNDYMSKILPLDLPESSPRRAGVGDGLRGINQG